MRASEAKILSHLKARRWDELYIIDVEADWRAGDRKLGLDDQARTL